MSMLNPGRKYNILFLMNGAKDPRGAEFLTLNLILNLSKEIFHPILVYAEEGVIVSEIKKAGITSERISVNGKITNIYLREEKLYNPFFVLRLTYLFLKDRSIFKIRKLIKDNNIHLIYCADNMSKLIGGIAGKMTKVKVVAHCHDDFQEDLLGKVMRVLYLLLMDKILAVSDKVKKFFRVNGGISEKVVTIYNGINKDVFDPDNVKSGLRKELGIDDNIAVIGSIGVLEKDKGHRYLFEAVSKLKSEGLNDFFCLICGTGPEEANLKRIVHEKGLKDNVLFLGLRKDIPAVLKALDMLVLTSLTIESFSLAAAEAMAMKVPVVASKIGGLPEVVEDGQTGILVPPGDAGALCDAIKYLTQNPRIRSDMGKKGRARVIDKFTIEKNIRETENIFIDMIRNGN